MAIHIRRREFVVTLGGTAAAWPLAARAQQATMPMIGLLHPLSPNTYGDRLGIFHRGLKDSGYVEGDNVTIVSRWAEGQTDQLQALAAELVRRQVSVITAFGPAAYAARAATKTIPIVFLVNYPVGLVAGLTRPADNLTGITLVTGESVARRLEIVRELVPAVTRVAVLVNPADIVSAEATMRDVEAASRAIGLQIQFLKASTTSEINAAFATVGRERPDALFVDIDPFFTSRRVQLVNLASRYAIPTTYPGRQFTEAGGLISYGTNLSDAWRQLGIYTGRILNGERPADLPVQQITKIELIINMKAAKTLGLTIPETLLATADEVIQ